MAWTWIQKPINKAILISAAILLIVSIGLLIWGITTHKEEVWLQACWIGDTSVLLQGEDQECRPGVVAPARWDKNKPPIRVTPMDPDGGTLEESSSGYNEVASAIRDVNTQWGFEFYSIGSEDDTDIEIIWGAPYVPGRGIAPSYCELHRSEESITYAIIGVRDTSSIRLTHRILIHQLGVAAGLARDDFESSIMYPVIADDTMGEMRMDRFTDADVAAIRNFYNE